MNKISETRTVYLQSPGCWLAWMEQFRDWLSMVSQRSIFWDCQNVTITFENTMELRAVIIRALMEDNVFPTFENQFVPAI